MTDTSSGPVYAAGAVCWRLGEDGEVRVLVVHRPRYDDLTLPKGKVDLGETLPQTAVREVFEETGLRIGLGVPLGATEYRIASGREKVVHYWAARADEDALRAMRFKPNEEVDRIEWMTLDGARAALSYGHDAGIVDAFERAHRAADGGPSFALIVLRHAKAVARGDWKRGSDAKRPLAPRGVAQARAIVPTLHAYAPRRIITSPATRCASTVAPLARALGRKPRLEPRLSQDAWEDGAGGLAEVVDKRLGSGRTAVLCSHRPVIPDLLRELAHATGTPMGDRVRDAAVLETAAFSVVHLSAADPRGGILAIETHRPLE